MIKPTSFFWKNDTITTLINLLIMIIIYCQLTLLKNLITTTNQYESQALECLMQAQNLAFLLDDTSLSQVIALEMIEIVARYDMSFCSQLIAFYQV